MNILLRKTTLDDLSFVINAETNLENKPFVGQWTVTHHEDSLNDPDIRHLIIEEIDTKTSVGYVILAGLTNKNKALELMRIVVTEKNKGYGRQALEMIKKTAFEELKFHRLWLDVKEHNILAKQLYEKVGFIEEGLLRDCVLVDNNYESLFVLSILEQDYVK